MSRKSFSYEVIVSQFEELGLNITNCRGQSYDNASNMAGQYSGLHARIKELCPLAVYVPCAAHSLNLVGIIAVECCHQVVSYFGVVQGLYNFFSVSTHRWNLLQTKLSAKNGISLKNRSQTRWSADADAVKALRQGYREIASVLEGISLDSSETPSTKQEARRLLSKLERLETAILTVVWDALLQQINNVGKTLQSSISNISIIVSLYISLSQFVQHVRNDFDTYETKAFELVENEISYAVSRKKNVTNRLLCASDSPAIALNDRDRFLFETHYVMCDALLSQLQKRKEAYEILDKRFGFLYGKDVSKEMQTQAKEFQDLYQVDIDQYFLDEIIQFKQYLSHTSISLDLNPEQQLGEIVKMNIGHTFPNVDTALRIVLSIPISNATSERSFSSLKRIKNRLRSNLSQEKLGGLSLLCIEKDLTLKMNFEDVISDFASKKCRKQNM